MIAEKRIASSIDYSSICYIYCWGIVLHVIDGTYDSSYDSDDGSLRAFEAGLEEGFQDGLKAGNRGMMR